MTGLRRTLLLSCLIACIARPVDAQEAESPAGWRTIVEPYFLAPNMSGTTGYGPFVGEVEANTGDILGALDFGAMLYLEVHDARWAFSLDTMYMNLGAETSNALGTRDLDLRQIGVIGAGYRRVAPWAEALAGLQYNRLEAGFASSGPLGVEGEGEKSWVDPYVGLRLMTPGAGPWRFGVFGAVGGFGVGSDFAWQVFPQAGYRVSELFEITGGLRAVDMDYEDDGFVYDMTTYGGQLGGRFHF